MHFDHLVTKESTLLHKNYKSHSLLPTLGNCMREMANIHGVKPLPYPIHKRATLYKIRLPHHRNYYDNIGPQKPQNNLPLLYNAFPSLSINRLSFRHKKS